MARSGRTGISSIVFGSRLRLAGTILVLASSFAWLVSSRGDAQGADATIANPILFVTQVPVPTDFTTITSPFGNHLGTVASAARGGDLWIRYPDGTLKNLTQAAGFGNSGRQGAKAIAVREPSVHWNATKALFSMVVGAPAAQYQSDRYVWQIYEISGLGRLETPVIKKVPNQPEGFNNVSPIYGSDDRIIFTSDRPRSGEVHLYPQLDEYEEAPTVTGLWRLDPSTGDLAMLQHSPSGSFSPQLDSFGRIIYTRWDHLQRDQQADADATGHSENGTFNYNDESADARRLNVRTEVYPEPRSERTDLLAGTNLEGHTFNDFFPWAINQDGTNEETVNHLGRHELLGYFDRSFKDDPNLHAHSTADSRKNPNTLDNLLQAKEDPTAPGTYYGIDAPEFASHGSGQVVKFNAPPTLNPDLTVVTYVTHRDTHLPSDSPSPNHSGLYRSPLPLSNGRVIVSHSPETRQDADVGTPTAPRSRYAYRLKLLEESSAGVFVGRQTLTSGIRKTVSWWDPDKIVTYDGELWELDAVEVRPRTRPVPAMAPLAPAVQQVLAQQGVGLEGLSAYLREHGLALLVSLNVTTRDRADQQQPFNLRVAGSSTETRGAGGKTYEIARLQLFQADQIRGLGGVTSPRPGRRVLAQPVHVQGAPIPVSASVTIEPDGSMAALVPAGRALSWQLTNAAGEPVVRERYWVTMQAGEVRVCASCHGINTADQAGNPPPSNEPQALRKLLGQLKAGGASFPAGKSESVRPIR